jgi:hypothetical protein
LKALVTLGLAGLAGCSCILGIEDLGGPNNPTPDGSLRDTGPDVPIANQVRLSGVATLFDGPFGGMTPLANATLAPFSRTPGVQTSGPVQTTSTGAYDFTFSTGGQAADVIIVAPNNGATTYPHTHNYPPILTRDLDFVVNVFSEQAIQSISQFAGEPRDPTQTFIAIQVRDQLGNAAAGVALETENGARIQYGDSQGLPTATEVQTSSSGVAFIFNSPPALGTLRAIQNGNVIGLRTIDGGGLDPQSPGAIAILLEVSQ